MIFVGMVLATVLAVNIWVLLDSGAMLIRLTKQQAAVEEDLALQLCALQETTQRLDDLHREVCLFLARKGLRIPEYPEEAFLKEMKPTQGGR